LCNNIHQLATSDKKVLVKPEGELQAGIAAAINEGFCRATPDAGKLLLVTEVFAC